MKPASVGIDLGTTNSCVVIYKHQATHVCKNTYGDRTTPSMVAMKDGQMIVGKNALQVALRTPQAVCFDAKRLIGRRFSDDILQADMKLLPYKIIADANDRPVIVLADGKTTKEFSPEAISAHVLTKMKEAAEAAAEADETVSTAVITVPAYFNDAQRSATMDAGNMANLNVLRIINEPTAAALAYAHDKMQKDHTGKLLPDESGERKVLVFDLGGGTFDVSVLVIDSGIIEVKSTFGDTHLGGEDFDHIITDWAADIFKSQTGSDMTKDNRAIKRLRAACQDAKKQLSDVTSVAIEVDSLLDGNDFTAQLTRAKMNDLCMDLFKKTLEAVDTALREAKFTKNDIDEVLLVGGSTRIRKIQEMLSNHFPGGKVSTTMDPDESVARGACIQAAVLQNVNDAKISDVLLLDVVPFSLGIETAGGIMTPIVEAQSTIPCSKSETFSTYADNQPGVSIQIFEGERQFTKDNHFLGKFEVTGIAPAPRGTPKIEVSFEIDANGVLSVKAEDKATGSNNKITITADRSRLSPDDIEKYKAEAAAQAEADGQRKAKVMAKMDLENLYYQLKGVLDDSNVASKLSSAETDSLKTKLSEINSWLDTTNVGDILQFDFEGKKKELESVSAPLMTKIYGGAAPGGGQFPAGMDPSAFAGAAAAGAQPTSEPTVEEID